ncbi:hypothetical protein [Hydromonas duriensis]|uniref:Uncharacterized protein n=1 Tax=Hydromonas duriensis TaxID=1527608 RepID=A0A4V3DJQ2_9BURK|nr:hypothetical protein [Hydromonas duriensis]TDR30975.1 hypothetical protein DFR44_11412 [Hydromonas duriensis]
MKNTKALFNDHLSALDNLLTQAHLQDDPALWLYQNNARTVLFYLEGMCRALAQFHDSKRFNKLTERFKTLEDALGQIDYFDAFVKEFSANPTIPADVVEHLTQERQMALLALNGALQKEGWIGESARRIKKIRKGKKTKSINWLSDEELVLALRHLYEQKIADITLALTQSFKSIENDLHELRRQVRWLSIYPQAFKGYITLAQPRRIVAKKFDKYLTDDIVHSPFNQLPQSDNITSPLQLNQNNFYAMSWFIAATGLLKDQGLRLDALTHSIHITQKVAPETAQSQAMLMLGSQQASTDEVLSAAQIIAKQLKMDAIFTGLVVG